MCDIWGYAALKSLGEGRETPPLFLRRLTEQLYEWTREVVCRHKQFPEGYTEWALTGHFAVVADRCNYLPIQECSIQRSANKTGRIKGAKRPDLYIYGQKGNCSVFFEFKKGDASLRKKSTGQSMDDLICVPL